jgi:hypothetical protein
LAPDSARTPSGWRELWRIRRTWIEGYPEQRPAALEAVAR